MCEVWRRMRMGWERGALGFAVVALSMSLLGPVGGLAQQGYPVSEEIEENSDTDGKVYTVQYFERAVFESHPENRAPNDVLLTLLGVFHYKQKYPYGAPGQVANTGRGSVLFKE